MVKYNVITTPLYNVDITWQGHVKIVINFPSMYLEKSTYNNFQILLTYLNIYFQHYTMVL